MDSSITGASQWPYFDSHLSQVFFQILFSLINFAEILQNKCLKENVSLEKCGQNLLLMIDYYGNFCLLDPVSVNITT